LKQNDFPAAHELLNRAKDIPLVEAQAHEMLAVLENKESGKTNLMRMRIATRSGIPNWSIEKRYVKLLDEAGAPDAAIAELKHCLVTQSYRAETWQLLSEIERKRGHHAEAEQALEMARRLDVHLSAKPIL